MAKKLLTKTAEVNEEWSDGERKEVFNFLPLYSP